MSAGFRIGPGSARVSRVGESVPLSRTFQSTSSIQKERLFRRDVETNTRGPSRTGVACATRITQ
jgi:hypothetical protein